MYAAKTLVMDDVVVRGAASHFEAMFWNEAVVVGAELLVSF